MVDLQTPFIGMPSHLQRWWPLICCIIVNWPGLCHRHYHCTIIIIIIIQRITSFKCLSFKCLLITESLHWRNVTRSGVGMNWDTNRPRSIWITVDSNIMMDPKTSNYIPPVRVRPVTALLLLHKGGPQPPPPSSLPPPPSHPQWPRNLRWTVRINPRHRHVEGQSGTVPAVRTKKKTADLLNN